MGAGMGGGLDFPSDHNKAIKPHGQNSINASPKGRNCCHGSIKVRWGSRDVVAEVGFKVKVLVEQWLILLLQTEAQVKHKLSHTHAQSGINYTSTRYP